jgi:uncharacterized repeat protein (TIGR01451 family)
VLSVLPAADGFSVALSGETDSATGAEAIDAWLGLGDDLATIDALVEIDAVLDGSDGNDTLLAGHGNDVLVGGSGSDSLDGGDGYDLARVAGTDGNDVADVSVSALNVATVTIAAEQDTLVNIEKVRVSGYYGDDRIAASFDPAAAAIEMWFDGHEGNDTLIGGPGGDFLLGGPDQDSIVGGGGDDVIFGAEGDDTVLADDGNDYVSGGWENDSIDGGSGDDTLAGWDDADTVLGGDGNDSIDGDAGSDSLDGGAGDDTAAGGDGDDTLAGQSGDDSLAGGFGNDSVSGGDGFDTLAGEAGSDTMSGGDGDDSIEGGLGADSVEAAAGNDSVVGGEGDDTIAGQAGNDSLYGGLGHDSISGGGGNDTLGSDHGNDTLAGGVGDDRISGGLDADLLDGGEGSDVLDGGAGPDVLIGGRRDVPRRERIGCDNDILNGGTEDDTLDGGRGADYLDGDDGTNDITADRRRDNIVQGRGTQRITDIQKTDRPCAPGRSARPRRPRPSALSPAVRDAAERARDEFVGPLPLPGAAPLVLGPVAVRSHTSNSADLRITQASATPTTAEYGQDLAYTIKVKNAGPRTARDFAVVDETSKDVAHNETTVNKGDWSGVGTIVWELPVLHDGSTATMNTSGTVISDSATAVQNKPLVQAGTPSDTHTSDNRATIITQLPKADLTLNLPNPPSSASPGGTIQIDYTVSNGGTHTATGVFVEDYLPPGVTFVPTTGCTYTAADRRVQCNVGQGQIAPGNEVSGPSLTVTVDAGTSGPVELTPEAVATEPDPVPADNRQEVVVNVTGAPVQSDLAIDKTCTPSVGTTNGVFGNVTCTLVATATGGSFSSVNINDRLPRKSVLVSASATTPSGAPVTCTGTKFVTCPIGAISAGQTATATVVYQPTKAGVHVNTGCVGGYSPETNRTNNCEEEPTTIYSQELLTIHRSSTKPGERPGPPVADKDEWTIGAFAVANINNTNANVYAADESPILDRDEQPVLARNVPPGLRGRDEVDLMALLVLKPTPADAGEVKIKITQGDAGVMEHIEKGAIPRSGG